MSAHLRLEIRLLGSMFSVRPSEWSVAVVGRPPLNVGRVGRHVVEWTWYDGTTFRAGRLPVEQGYPQTGVAASDGTFWRHKAMFRGIPTRTFSADDGRRFLVRLARTRSYVRSADGRIAAAWRWAWRRGSLVVRGTLADDAPLLVGFFLLDLMD